MNSVMFRLTLALVAVAALVAGCSQDFDTTGAPTGPVASMSSHFTGFDGTIQTATLHLYVNRASGHPVHAHRVTSDWEEMIVTWNNFGGFDGTSLGSFMSDGLGWRTVDVTATVQGWLDGDFPNYGFLLKQVDGAFPRTEVNSREAADFHPMLEVCFDNGAGTTCAMIPASADASIFENHPNDNVGAVPELFIGWFSATELEKQGLVRFELPEPEDGDSQLLPTGQDCDDFLSGTAPDLVMTVGNSGNIAPGAFFFYNSIHASGNTTIVMTQSATPMSATLPDPKGAKVFIIDDGGWCMNISQQEGVTISIVDNVITVFVPEMYADMSHDNMLIVRGEYGSVKRTGVAGTEYCFQAMVNGSPFSEECLVVQ